MAVKISRILHAGYVFELGPTTIAFDPIFENPFSVNCHAFPPVRFDLEPIRNLRLDAVFISHYHDDHCSLASLDLLARTTVIFIFCVYPEMAEMIRALGFTDVRQLELDVAVTVGKFQLTARRALDGDVDSIFEIKADGLQILNVVDSWIDPSTLQQLLEVACWDLILWPFQMMRELEMIAPSLARNDAIEFLPEWVEQIRLLNPKCIVPSSCQFKLEPWSWANAVFFPMSYQKFAAEMARVIPQARVVRLDPGTSVTLDHDGVRSAARLEWIEPIGDQSVDYEFSDDVDPPSTAEIAKNFAVLTIAQAQRVAAYCAQGLPAAFGALPDFVPADFIWSLSTFDHAGQATQYVYKVKDGQMELIGRDLSSTGVEATWVTEVPATKLYAALERGESLTSMYVRIKARDIELADIVDDPLVRSLFTGVFGAYQAAQLKTLRDAKKHDINS